jgi:hypothetical protein
MELQGLGVHGRNQGSSRQFWNHCKGFHRKLVNGSEVRREKGCQQAGCPCGRKSSDRTGEN